MLGLGVRGLGLIGLRVLGLGFRVCLGFRVFYGLGFWV